MNGIRRLWRGELPLAEAFWTWAVGIGLAINLVSLAVSLILLVEDRPVAALVVGYGIPVPYNVVATVGVWRSAARHAGDPGYARTMRIATVVMMIVFCIV